MGRPAHPKDIKYIEDDNGCFNCISHYASINGYPRIKRGKKIIGVHQYVWEQKNGIIPERKTMCLTCNDQYCQNPIHKKMKTQQICICHTCDNKKCVNIKHLFIGTQEDNMKDASNKGRMYRSKRLEEIYPLSEEQVKQIFTSKKQSTILAKEYSLKKHVIYSIKKKKNWKDITEGITI